MKQKVIEFFQNLPEAPYEQFNKAFELYRQSDGKNIAIERVINATGYTPSGLQNLLYDLQKLHGITDVEKVASSQVAVSSLPVAETEAEYERRMQAEYQEELRNLECTKEELEAEKETLEFENLDLKEEIETLKLAPKLDAKAIRVEFPFLNEKECPDEFKILVADKITAWNEYLAIQEELVRIESGEDFATPERKANLGELAISYFDENQKIYDELNCYQTTGKVLGVHPIFKKLKLTREIETMTTDDLIKYKGSSAKYFSVKKTALEKAKRAKDTAKIEEIEAAVAERSEKLFLVNKKLGV
jgi:hypothetical protein